MTSFDRAARLQMTFNVDSPDPRIVEDIIAAGAIALKRQRRDVSDAARLEAIETAARWLLEHARELREAIAR